jgi:predicted ATP-binding protein involved in virulence
MSSGTKHCSRGDCSGKTGRVRKWVMSATHTIERILIKKVRHLQDVDIQIGCAENGKPKHLIITGPNGSGKTSLLEALKPCLESIVSGIPLPPDMEMEFGGGSAQDALSDLRREIESLDSRLTSVAAAERSQLLRAKSEQLGRIQQIKDYVGESLGRFGTLQIDIQDALEVSMLWGQGRFILAYFPASRQNRMQLPTVIEKIVPQRTYRLDEPARSVFVRYIVNLKATRSFAREAGDAATAADIDAWFEVFEQALRDIYEDAGLKLLFDIATFAFRIQLSDGRDPFDLNQLSDGYQSLLSIVTEVLLRMESGAAKVYDLPGIVLIDEIETHLHVSLQKKVLPFLTSFFPKVQFIVTSHSPFVLTSLSNAVVYDLGSRTRVEDLSGYSSEAVLEGYFDQDKYSLSLKVKVGRYRELTQRKSSLTDKELNERDDLQAHLHELPKAFSPELEDELRLIEEQAS